jgi:uncharacterized protein (TIGR04255 family)
MRPKTLSHKPLVEAILELRWQPSYTKEGGIDSDSRLFLGKFYDLLAKDYPSFEVLPTAAAPEQMTPNLAQYRFRQKDGGWPLIQIGSGVMTLNETSAYTWDDFKRRAEQIVNVLLQNHPSRIVPTTLELRYINAVNVDFEKDDTFRYLGEKLRVGISIPSNLFEDGRVRPDPSQFAMQIVYPIAQPVGALHLRVAKGKANDRDAIIWETVIHSEGKELPPLPKDFMAWLDPAHALAEDWFFKLVEHELLEQLL